MTPVLFVLGSYLLGAIPFGLLVTRLLARRDVRQVGSGNIGATNVARAAGKLAAVITLILDALKGFLPVMLAMRLFGVSWWTAAAGLAAVLGHVFPVYLRFRGGKGVATALGLLVATLPGVALIGVLIWAGMFLLLRVSSVGSLTAALACTTLVLVRAPAPLAAMFTAVVVLVLVRHAGNIRRLLRREEGKV